MREIKKRSIRRPGMFLASWAFLIFFTSAMPAAYFPALPVTWLPKAVHVMYYFIFCALAFRLFRCQSAFPSLRRLAVPLSLLLSVLYAFSDEAHQMVVDGRTARLSDVAIDASSAFLCVIVIWGMERVRSWRSGSFVA